MAFSTSSDAVDFEVELRDRVVKVAMVNPEGLTSNKG